jgi:seryl-tRNA synthetase
VDDSWNGVSKKVQRKQCPGTCLCFRSEVSKGKRLTQYMIVQQMFEQLGMLAISGPQSPFV